MKKKKPLIQSLDRALDILELIRDSSVPVRASDIAEQLGLGVATAHNIIRSLFYRGYLTQNDSSRYMLGRECLKLYKAATDNFEELRNIVKAPVEELAKRTGDTTFFGIERLNGLYCLALSMGGGALVVNNSQEWLDRLHCTAAGKIVISEKGMEWFRGLCEKHPPVKFSKNTVITVESMSAELEKIRNDGYALSIGECSEGIAAIGIAVYTAKGSFLGSLAQSFPSFYLESGKIIPAERVALLRKYAKMIINEYGT